MAIKNSGAERVQRRRDKLRAAGLRPIQIWLPDTKAPGFVDECARQARLVRDNEDHDKAAAWARSSDETGWTA